MFANARACDLFIGKKSETSMVGGKIAALIPSADFFSLIATLKQLVDAKAEVRFIKVVCRLTVHCTLYGSRHVMYSH